jgi:Flp pilus assembly pilin Flp
MKHLKRWIQGAASYRALGWRLGRDPRGQDLIEYALMAGFVAVAAGALMPTVATSISTVFSKVNSVMAHAAAS